jgi:ferredoxin
MPYVITEPCINTKDRACVDVCPVDCIYEGPEQLYINPDECIDCGACEPACPTKAIFPEESVPAKWKEYVQLNADLCKTWPNITDKKDPLPDADAWKDKEDKRQLLEGA